MQRKEAVLFCLIVGMLCVSVLSAFTVYAAEEPQGESTYLQTELRLEEGGEFAATDLKLPSVFGVMMRLFIALLIIMGLIWAAALFYKKVLSPQYVLGNDRTLIKVLSYRYLDPKKAIYLIEIVGKVLVVASTPERLALLSEIDDVEDIQKIYNLLDLNQETVKGKEFNKVLAAFNGNQSGTGAEPSEKQQNVFARGFSNFQLQMQKIKQMINEK